MRGAAREELDRIDELQPGSGRLEAFGFMRGDLGEGILGGALQYNHRIRTNLSVFARGEVGYQYGAHDGLVANALFGGRWTF